MCCYSKSYSRMCLLTLPSLDFINSRTATQRLVHCTLKQPQLGQCKLHSQYRQRRRQPCLCSCLWTIPSGGLLFVTLCGDRRASIPVTDTSERAAIPVNVVMVIWILMRVHLKPHTEPERGILHLIFITVNLVISVKLCEVFMLVSEMPAYLQCMCGKTVVSVNFILFLNSSI